MALISAVLSPSSLALSFSCTARFRGTNCYPFLRSNLQKNWNWRGNGKKSLHGFPSMASHSPSFETIPPCSSNAFLEVAKLAREKFTQEISFRLKDTDVSIAKALLYVALEDEAILAFNGDKDACSFAKERNDESMVQLDDVCIGGKSISGWLSEFDILTKEVEAELVQREIGCHLVQIIEAVNTVLFESRCFLRFPVLVDARFSYLHHALKSNCGTAIMLSIIYMEICRRLGVSIVGSPLGEDFLIWPQTQTPERLHWKRASKGNHGLMLVSPLRSISAQDSLLQPVELTYLLVSFW